MKIAVVGAGIVGCAVAHELVSRGAAVHLVDARGVGQGATQASAGILAPYIEGHVPALLSLGVSSLALYDDYIARLRRETSLPIEYERCGTLQVALNEVEVAELGRMARSLDAAGESHARLTGSEARRAEPGLSERVLGALLIPRHGYVAATALAAALLQAASARGATISKTSVLGMTSHEGGIRLRTPEAAIHADAVILAAGSWTSGIAPRAGDGETGVADDARRAGQAVIRPIRGQLVRLSAANRPAARVVWRGDCYLVPWLDGSVLVGATVEEAGFNETATAGGVQGLLLGAAELVPALAEAEFREVRVGLRPGTPDELPVIGASSTMRNVFYATGHYRSGVLLAPLTATLVADLVLDGASRQDLELTRPDRFGM